MRASTTLLLSGMLAGACTTGAGASVNVPHDLERTQVGVTFYNDGTFQVDVLNPPEWFLDRLAPLSGLPLSRDLEGAARDRRIAEMAGTFAEWVWLLFDGVRVEAKPEYLPAPPDPSDPSKPPLATMRIRGSMPEGATEFSWAYGLVIDPYPMSITDGAGEIITHWVEGPFESDRFEISGLTPPSRWTVVLTYLKLGFTHILPKGLDHILFVIGIFLLSTRMRPIVAQVTTFTVAHTITLGMTIFGVISLRSSIVEPLIALSIVYVAVENLLTSQLKPRRLALVFAFGLLHGMGFASVLSELGLPRSERATALLTFNLGVEGGQLAVIAMMFTTVGWLRHNEWYRRRTVWPLSIAIAAVGLYWTVTRIAGS